MSSPDPGRAGGRPIVVGLAAHNEAETVARVARVASEGIARAFPEMPRLIILSDNGSTDGTADAFRAARFEGERRVLTTEDGLTGKGHAVKAVLEEAVTANAAVVVLMDADLVSAGPGWVERLARPVLDGKALCTPLYLRDARDGAVTRHLGYPLVLLFTGLDIRQPIGGEYALSMDLAKRTLAREWPTSALGYGVDILITLEAARAGLPIASSHLGAKIHSPSAPKLVRIFCEVASTVFALAAEGAFPAERAGDVEVKEVPAFGEDVREDVPPVEVHVRSFMYVARRAWEECGPRSAGVLTDDVRRRIDHAFESCGGRVDEGLWHDCLVQALRRVREGASPTDVARILLAPFLGRTACFWEQVRWLSIEEVEETVAASARRFLPLARAASGADGGA